MDRINNAIKNFYNGYNCCQSLVLAYCDMFNLDSEKAAYIASGFGAGMGGLREKCGAVTAMFMLAGLAKKGYDRNCIESKKDLYSLIKLLNGKFEERFKTTNCKELLKKANVFASSTPSARTKEYYNIRPCACFVEYAGELVEKYILSDVLTENCGKIKNVILKNKVKDKQK